LTDPPPVASSGKSIHHHNANNLFGHPDFKQFAPTLGEARSSNNEGSSQKVGTASDALASASAKRFALLNQHLAGNFADQSHYGSLTTARNGLSQHPAEFLAIPLH
jgi:hypothetical protein